MSAIRSSWKRKVNLTLNLIIESFGTRIFKASVRLFRNFWLKTFFPLLKEVYFRFGAQMERVTVTNYVNKTWSKI